MNKATSMLAMTGIALVGGLAFGAGPAMAASATPASSTVAADHKVVDYYDSYRECDRAGSYGEHRGDWDDYSCVRVDGHHGDYALVVDYHTGPFGHGRPGHFPGHHFPGHDFPGHHGHR